MDYLRLLRVRHYLKNLLIFIPLFFNKNILDVSCFFHTFIGFICFCFVASAVYIFNDIRDVDKDRLHTIKKNRPIASGRISVRNAYMIMILCLFLSIILILLFFDKKSLTWLIIYFVLNISYSFKLKDYPIIDIVILASGFVIRILYGGVISAIPISKWLSLVVMTGALFMGLGKRRNELRVSSNTRKVLRYYTDSFLDKNMYVCVALTIVFYALWTIESLNPAMVWTVPMVLIIFMKYSLIIEGISNGDPVEVFLHDKTMIFLALSYIVVLFALLYA